MGVIYKITSPSNKVYVGKTYDLKKRISCHKCAAKKGSNIILHNSIKKYGWNAHVLNIIEEIPDDFLNEREIFWIAELKTYCYEYPMGMNMTKGGEGQRSTWMHKRELRKWFSDKFSGEGNPFYNKKHTDETKSIIGLKASERNKTDGRKIPKWGVEKGRDVVRKKVLCYDANGNFLKEYSSITEAAQQLGVNRCGVSDNCLGKATNAGGYVFKFKNGDVPTKIIIGEIKAKAMKRPVLFISEDFEVICEYPSAKEASDFFGIPKGSINRASNNYLKPIRTGHVFIYKDLWEELEASELV